ncbi:MAG TPA: ABC transporter ATP-binding protein [Streptosporangiaceae bacterium]
MRALPVADPGTPDLRSPARYITWLISRQKGPVGLGVLWGCVWMVAQALAPAAIGAAIDGLVARRTWPFTQACLLVLALGLIAAGSGLLRHRCVVGMFLDAAYRTVQLITGQAARLGHTLARLVTTGEVVSVGTADVQAIGNTIDVTGRGSGAIAALITVAVVLLVTSPALGLIVLIGAPLLTGTTSLVLRPLHRRQRRYRDRQGELAARAADIVSGLRVLRGIGGEDAFATRYHDQSQALRHTGVHVARAETYLFAAEILVPGAFITAATWIAAHYALHGQITPGELVTFYGYASFLTLPLATLTEAADKVTRGLVAAERVVRFLSLPPDVNDPDQPAASPPPGAGLHDPVSGLTVRAGELVGVAPDDPAQGAALARRLGRYGPETDDGAPAAELGGTPLRCLPVAEVRRRILVAQGDAHLFAGPLAEALGGPGASEAAVTQALHVAAAQDAVDAIPGGRRGLLASRGRTLSGGQAQRLRLARALLAEPEVLILIEPTSAVDAHTEAAIAGRLRAARRGRATVLITTSPLLLDAADRVAYLAGGRVTAAGRHRDLLSASPAYADAVTRGEDS